MNILISGGGTGGHIFPALSIADAIKRRHPESKILFVGAEGRMEMQRVPDAGYEIIGLPVSGFDRRHLWRNIKVLWKLNKSMRLAKRVVKEFKPDIAIGVGGYASGPTLKAAQRAGVPTLLQEQNSYAGVTNKLLAANASAICVAYDGMERFFPAETIVKTGNPVRADIVASSTTREEAKRQLGFDPHKPLVAIVGGSLGARTINRAMARSLKPLAERGAGVLWQCGKFYKEEYMHMGEGMDNVTVTDFIKRMDLVYRAADIIVSRAGAGTISELQIAGAPAILIPSPNVAEDHQRHNAEALSSRGAAILLLDAEAEDKLLDNITQLLDSPQTRENLSIQVKKMALPGASEHIVDIIDKIIAK
ncbi:MAG: undecaprenyldiphospho-muramoylpentapeptide beta-N-acetylglucosaminyltransferase [Clostridiales bacterium]|nr:undecaprenyldiphospho-muramoylpentapeptide beta-N-acetylglucosaminyltransferase [Clostridiales bacterium]